MLDRSPPNERRLFRTGEHVVFGGGSGTIVAAFPDGFHLIRLDTTGQITGAHGSQMKIMDEQRGERARPMRGEQPTNQTSDRGAPPGQATKNK